MSFLLLFSVSLWLCVSVLDMPSLRKTGGVMRFCDHGSAADVYRNGNCRGICVKIVLELSAGRVGFLVNGAQRAGLAESKGRIEERESGRNGDWASDGDGRGVRCRPAGDLPAAADPLTMRDVPLFVISEPHAAGFEDAREANLNREIETGTIVKLELSGYDRTGELA